MSRTRTRLALTVVALCVAMALAGCGSSSGTSSGSARPGAAPPAAALGAARLISSSADKAVAARTARLAGTVSVRAGSTDETIPLDGAFDVEHGSLQLSVDPSGLGLGGRGDAHFEVRLVDGVMYVHLGGASGAGSVLGGKAWLKLDTRSLPGASGALGDLDPAGTLDALRGVAEVQRVGADQVRGVETTHYRVVIDPARALAKVPPELRARAQKGLEQLGPRTPADVWIDADGQMRRMSLGLDAPTGRVTQTIELYDFGAPVAVVAPPADQVADLSRLFGGLGSLGAVAGRAA